MIINGWFECKVKLEKQVEGKDLPQKVTQTYLIDALNFTEAESRIIEEVTPYCANGPLEVDNIKRARYSELFPSELESADKWYKVKCVFIQFDDKTQTEKRTSTNILVQAGNVADALQNFEEGMKGTMGDYEVAAITETAILDVFPYSQKEDKQNDKPEFEQG